MHAQDHVRQFPSAEPIAGHLGAVTKGCVPPQSASTGTRSRVRCLPTRPPRHRHHLVNQEDQTVARSVREGDESIDVRRPLRDLLGGLFGGFDDCPVVGGPFAWPRGGCSSLRFGLRGSQADRQARQQPDVGGVGLQPAGRCVRGLFPSVATQAMKTTPKQALERPKPRDWDPVAGEDAASEPHRRVQIHP